MIAIVTTREEVTQNEHLHKRKRVKQLNTWKNNKLLQPI